MFPIVGNAQPNLDLSCPPLRYQVGTNVTCTVNASVPAGTELAVVKIDFLPNAGVTLNAAYASFGWTVTRHGNTYILIRDYDSITSSGPIATFNLTLNAVPADLGLRVSGVRYEICEGNRCDNYLNVGNTPEIPEIPEGPQSSGPTDPEIENPPTSVDSYVFILGLASTIFIGTYSLVRKKNVFRKM